MNLRIITSVCSLGWLTLSACNPSVPGATPAVISGHGVEERIESYVNRARINVKRAPLERDQRLDDLARQHAIHVAGKRQNNHDGFHHRAAETHRITGASVYGENVHIVPNGPDSARVLVEGWLASRKHRRLLENRLWNVTGIGTHTNASGEIAAVQIFGVQP